MVPPFRCSPGRTRRRRAHQAIKAAHTTLCPNCGAAKRSHTACSACGYVRPGLQIKNGKGAMPGGLATGTDLANVVAFVESIK